MFNDFISQLFVFPLFLVFLRVGAAMMVFPAYSDPAISPRFRLLLAMMISLITYPAVFDRLPSLPGQSSVMVYMVFSELLIGILMAIGARLFITAMSMAGDIISFMSGFQTASLFDPRTQSTSTEPALFLTMVGTVIVLTSGLHLILIQALVESYTKIPVGQVPPMGDVNAALVRLLMDIFVVGVKLAAPVLAAGFLVYLGFGVLNRLVPQVQSFFVAMPVNIMVGVLLLGVGLGAMITLFQAQVIQHAILFNQEQP